MNQQTIEVIKDISKIFTSGGFITILGLLFMNYKRDEFIFTKSIFSPVDSTNMYIKNISKFWKKILYFCIFVLFIGTFSCIFLATYSPNIYVRIVFIILTGIYALVFIYITYTMLFHANDHFKLPFIDHDDQDFYIIGKLSDTTYIIQKCELYKKSEEDFELIDIKDISKFKLVHPE